MNKNWDRPSRKFFQTFTYIIILFLKTVDDFFKVYKYPLREDFTSILTYSL